MPHNNYFECPLCEGSGVDDLEAVCSECGGVGEILDTNPNDFSEVDIFQVPVSRTTAPFILGLLYSRTRKDIEPFCKGGLSNHFISRQHYKR